MNGQTSPANNEFQSLETFKFDTYELVIANNIPYAHTNDRAVKLHHDK